jgi:putative transferase (TIGR04331 family)
MDQRVLVTTALEATWPTNGEPILFLGEWCRRFNRQDKWQILDSEIVPYHWDEPGKLYIDYQYLQTLYEELVPTLSARLNYLHDTNHEDRYWRILVGPWLVKFLHVLFDRYESVKQLSTYSIHSSIVLTNTIDIEPANDTAGFTELYSTDLWNHALFAYILRELEVVDTLAFLESNEGDTDEDVDLNPTLLRSPISIGWKALGIYNKVALRFRRQTDVVLYLTYLHPFDEFRLRLRLFQIPCIQPVFPRFDETDIGATDSDRSLRDWRLFTNRDDVFVNILSKVIARHIPKVFLEGYSSLERQVELLPLPASPKAIWTSNAHFSDDLFNLWAGRQVEAGCPLLVGQHGGVFGLARFSPQEDHERLIGDISLTWGWSEEGEHCYVPIGHFPRPNRPLGIKHASLPKGLLVSQVTVPRAFEAIAGIVGSQWLSYFDFQCRMLEALPNEIRQAFTVRTVDADPGWDQIDRWKDRLPTLDVDDGTEKLVNLIHGSRLCIGTGNCTVFQELFLMQVPTMLVWNPAHWEIRESAQYVFDALRDVGIFHTDPESAANHIVAIWQDTDAWWNDTDVQVAVSLFNSNYNQAPDGVISRLRRAIVDSASHSEMVR